MGTTCRLGTSGAKPTVDVGASAQAEINVAVSATGRILRTVVLIVIHLTVFRQHLLAGNTMLARSYALIACEHGLNRYPNGPPRKVLERRFVFADEPAISYHSCYLGDIDIH